MFKTYCVVVDIHCQTNKIINVEVYYASWVDWDDDNQIPSDPKMGVIGQNDLVRYKVLCWRLERQRIPVIAEQNCIG